MEKAINVDNTKFGRELMKEVCLYFSILPEDMFARIRKREIIEKRQMFHYILKKHSRLSLEDIGKINTDAYGYEGFGVERNHATVLNSVKTIEDLIETNIEYRRAISELEIIAKEVKKKIINSVTKKNQENTLSDYKVKITKLICKAESVEDINRVLATSFI